MHRVTDQGLQYIIFIGMFRVPEQGLVYHALKIIGHHDKLYCFECMTWEDVDIEVQREEYTGIREELRYYCNQCFKNKIKPALELGMEIF